MDETTRFDSKRTLWSARRNAKDIQSRAHEAGVGLSPDWVASGPYRRQFSHRGVLIASPKKIGACARILFTIDTIVGAGIWITIGPTDTRRGTVATIRVVRTDNIKLICKAADNAVHAYLNGDEVYAKQGVDEQNFTDERRLTESMQDGYNVLTVLGVKWGSNTRFNVTVELNGNIVGSHVELLQPVGSQARGIVWDFSVEFNMVAA
jgi:hypothetical protein